MTPAKPKPITIAREVIRMTDAAKGAQEYGLIGALHQMVEQLARCGATDADVDIDVLLEYIDAAGDCDYCRADDGKPSANELKAAMNRQLARRPRAQVDASDAAVLQFEPMVYLVTAAYAMNKNGATAGVSIALIVDQDGVVTPARELKVMAF